MPLPSHCQRRPCVRRRVIPRLESLEDRTLLAVAPQWFAVLAPQAHPASGESVSEWVVQLPSYVTPWISSVTDCASFFQARQGRFEVAEGLGSTGLLLVRAYGMTSADALRDLGANARVESVYANERLSASSIPNDPRFAEQWDLNNTGANGGLADADIDWPEATGLAVVRQKVVVGVIDTGVDYTHPDLAANIWTNPGEIPGNNIDDDGDGFIDDVHGYDFVHNDGDPMDDNGHGTHVSGTIAAVTNNGAGVAGVAPDAQIMALKFLGADGSGATSDAIRAVNYATMMKTRYNVNVRVTNNSWGGSSNSRTLSSAINSAGQAGILFVAAAGNSSANSDTTPDYPAAYTLGSIISVAATTSRDALASFSNYGPVSVDVGAPGVGILSTLPNNTYGFYSGTSMATPHVTGLAALAWETFPTKTLTDIRNAILQGVDPLASLSGKVATGGRINARHTLELLGATPAPPQAVVQLSQGQFFAGENDGTVPISVVRSGDTSQAVTVSFTVTAGTATAGNDYTTASGSLTLAAGQTTGSFSLTLVNDSVSEPVESFTVTVHATGTNVADGSRTQAQVVVADDDGPVPTTLGPTAAGFAHSFEYYNDVVGDLYQRFLGRAGADSERAGWISTLQGGLSQDQLAANFLASAEYYQKNGGTSAGWVAALYRDVLDRTASTAEVNSWSGNLTAGWSRGDVALAFLSSGERRTQQVSDLYFRVLGRQAGSGEVAGWVQGMQKGTRYEDVLVDFVASAENYTRAGHNAKGWIDAAYRQLFNRPADVDAYSNWLGPLTT